MRIKVSGAKELRARIQQIRRSIEENTKEGRRVGLHTSAEVYPEDGSHPGFVARVHEHGDEPVRGFFHDAVEKAAPEVLDALGDNIMPDGRGAPEAMEQAGLVLKKGIQKGIVDAGLLRTGHLKGQVSSVKHTKGTG